jgi:hypothetical protein
MLTVEKISEFNALIGKLNQLSRSLMQDLTAMTEPDDEGGPTRILSQEEHLEASLNAAIREIGAQGRQIGKLQRDLERYQAFGPIDRLVQLEQAFIFLKGIGCILGAKDGTLLSALPAFAQQVMAENERLRGFCQSWVDGQGTCAECEKLQKG